MKISGGKAINRNVLRYVNHLVYLLDTDTCIFLLNRKNLLAEKRLRELSGEGVALSAITMAELYFGAMHSEKKKINEERVRIFCSSFTIRPFDAESAQIFGATKELLVKQGAMIGVMDLLIASIALSKNAILVTHNTKELQRIPGLRTEDWFE